MNILFACDENYATHLLVLIKSIQMHTKSNLAIYILDMGIKTKTKETIAKHFSDIQIEFIAVDEEDFAQFPKTISYISLATNARLKCCDYLPTTLDKILYLDIDIIVSGDLQKLWQTDLQDKSIGVCFDTFIAFDKKHKEKISLNADDPYFNAGVMLIDLKKWREKDIFELSLDVIKTYKDKLHFQDQDILNIVFKNDALYLDNRFNFQPTQLRRIKKFKRGKLQKLYALEKTTFPIVVSHFCGPDKSWHEKSRHINSHLYWDILKEFDKKQKLSIFYRLDKRLRKLFYKFRYHIS